MHEIVTLQFGQQSNYLGTHFWNAQESYFTYPPEPESPVNHDIHFRTGIAPDGSDTFTPRALIYDLKGAFGSMRKINALYEPEDDEPANGTSLWPSKPAIHRAEPIPQSTYQTHLDAGLEPPPLTASTVRYWSDYSRVYYHPKSLIQLSEFDVNDRLKPFEKWDVGLELFEKLEKDDDLVDRDFRPFIEECDGLQALQILTGVDDAWGGWASGWIERLRDDYGKLSIWTSGIGDQGGNSSLPRQTRLEQAVNSARSLHVLAEHSSVYIPVSNRPFRSPSYLTADFDSSWHIGALQAVALESLTMSSRLRSCDGRRGTLSDLEETINSTGKRKVAKLEMSIADPDVLAEKAAPRIDKAEKVGSTLSEHSSKDGAGNLTEFEIDAFTKDYRIATAKSRKEHIFGRIEGVRGEWTVNDGEELDPHDRFAEGPVIQRYAAPLLFPVLHSFPAIFDVGTSRPKNLAVHTGLTTSTTVADQVRTLEQLVRRLVTVDERESLCNGLQTLAEEYDEGWDSGSDSDFDEA